MFEKLQKLHRKWANENFGDTDSHFARRVLWCVMGVQEEAGELSHAILKCDQGIRGGAEEHAEAARDAVGDIVLYLIDLCNQCGWDFVQIVRDVAKEVHARDWNEHPEDGGGDGSEDDGGDVAGEQPPPTEGEVEVAPVLLTRLRDHGANQLADLVEERAEAGEREYGTPLMSHNGRDAEVDAVQEIADLAMYWQQLQMEDRSEALAWVRTLYLQVGDLFCRQTLGIDQCDGCGEPSTDLRPEPRMADVNDPPMCCPACHRTAVDEVVQQLERLEEAITPGVRWIMQERQRQRRKGYDHEHDAQHTEGELSEAARAYLVSVRYRRNTADLVWPFDEPFEPSGDELVNFGRAGALIAAEIDRRAADHSVGLFEALGEDAVGVRLSVGDTIESGGKRSVKTPAGWAKQGCIVEVGSDNGVRSGRVVRVERDGVIIVRDDSDQTLHFWPDDVVEVSGADDEPSEATTFDDAYERVCEEHGKEAALYRIRDGVLGLFAGCGSVATFDELAETEGFTDEHLEQLPDEVAETIRGTMQVVRDHLESGPVYTVEGLEGTVLLKGKDDGD